MGNNCWVVFLITSAEFLSPSLLFGVSLLVTALRLGNPAFMSPEQCTGDLPEGETSYASDIWSLGVTFFYLVFGRHPFTATTRAEYIQAIRDEDVHFPEQSPVRRQQQGDEAKMGHLSLNLFLSSHTTVVLVRLGEQ